MQLTEKYRPRDWPDVIGQERITGALAELEAAGRLSGHAYWISGRSGNGKTTIARIIASKVSTPDLTSEYDAGELTAQVLRDIQTRMQGVIDTKACPLFEPGHDPLGGKAYCIIVNEAHRLRGDCVTRLCKLTEEPMLDDHVTWIFTTTVDGMDHFENGQMDAKPLLSRCMVLTLSQRGNAEKMAERVREIAQKEGLDGKPLQAYTKAMYNCGSNMRALLQHVEAGGMRA